MGKSIRSKQKRKWRRIKRDKIYKPLAEERLMAALSTLNTAVIVQNGGSGSIGKLKDLLSGRKNSNAKTSNPDGLKALHKFKNSQYQLLKFLTFLKTVSSIFLLSDNNFPKSLKDNTKSTLLSIKIFR